MVVLQAVGERLGIWAVGGCPRVRLLVLTLDEACASLCASTQACLCLWGSTPSRRRCLSSVHCTLQLATRPAWRRASSTSCSPPLPILIGETSSDRRRCTWQRHGRRRARPCHMTRSEQMLCWSYFVVVQQQAFVTPPGGPRTCSQAPKKSDQHWTQLLS